MQLEEWKALIGWEGIYEVSSLGSIKRVGLDRLGRKLRIGHLLTGRKGKDGRLYVRLPVSPSSSDQKNFSVHRLVCRTFHGEPLIGKEVNHKDGDPSNNVATNLEWVSHSLNCLHAYQTGLRTVTYSQRVAGIKSSAKLTQEDVDLIRKSPLSSLKLSPLLGVSSTTIRSVRQGKTYLRPPVKNLI